MYVYKKYAYKFIYTYTDIFFDFLLNVLPGRSYNEDGNGRNCDKKEWPWQQYSRWKF
jgi:hypothetical protein